MDRPLNSLRLRAARGSAAAAASTRRHIPESPATRDRIYNDQEMEVLQAVQSYKNKHGIRFLSVTDIFGVILALGYRKDLNAA